MQVKPIGNTPFKANIKGEVNKLIKLSLDAGVPYEKITKSLNEIHKLCPGKNDNVYLYFRKYESGFLFAKPFYRSGIKVVQNGKIKELNVDPTTVAQDDILGKFVKCVKKLVKGEVAPEETAKEYYINRKSGWLYRYRDLAEDRRSF